LSAKAQSAYNNPRITHQTSITSGRKKEESGYISNPSMETLLKLADAFGIGLDELVGRKEEIKSFLLFSIFIIYLIWVG